MYPQPVKLLNNASIITIQILLFVKFNRVIYLFIYFCLFINLLFVVAIVLIFTILIFTDWINMRVCLCTTSDYYIIIYRPTHHSFSQTRGVSIFYVYYTFFCDSPGHFRKLKWIKSPLLNSLTVYYLCPQCCGYWRFCPSPRIHYLTQIVSEQTNVSFSYSN